MRGISSQGKADVLHHLGAHFPGDGRAAVLWFCLSGAGSASQRSCRSAWQLTSVSAVDS